MDDPQREICDLFDLLDMDRKFLPLALEAMKRDSQMPSSARGD